MSIRDDLQEQFNAYVTAYEAGDAAACANVFTADAELHSPYAPPARGRAEIEALHRNWTEVKSEGKKLDIVHFGQSGNLAWCLATYSEGHATGNRTSLNILERQPGGPWRIRLCSMNNTDA